VARCLLVVQWCYDGIAPVAFPGLDACSPRRAGSTGIRGCRTPTEPNSDLPPRVDPMISGVVRNSGQHQLSRWIETQFRKPLMLPRVTAMAVRHSSQETAVAHRPAS
jgi:hypothetical protein